MAEDKAGGAATTLAKLRPLLPLIAAALLLHALWLAWSGWQLSQGEARLRNLTSARDSAVTAISQRITRETATLRDKLALPAVVTALEAGDLTAAANLIAAGWGDVENVEVLPADLAAAYAALPKSGYGRLAAAEAALAANAPVARVARDGEGARLVLVAPAQVRDQVVGVVYVRFPLTALTGAVSNAAVGSDSYLALRQGRYNIVEQGDSVLADGAESLAAPVPGSELRVVAAAPDELTGAWGLNALGSFVAAALSALLGFVVLNSARQHASKARVVSTADSAEPTLTQALLQPPPEDKPKRAIEVRSPGMPAPVAIEKSIFRAYDIRGVIGQTLDVGVAELIGHAVGSLMQQQGLTDIVVGRDGRLSGPELSAGLIEGLRRAGRNVIDIGLGPTPLIYFGTFHLRTGCGIAVTGSHNPPDYNGFKIVVGGEALYGEAITDLYARIAEDRLYEASAPGNLQARDIAEDYVNRVASDVQIDRRLKVVVDAGNGAAGELGPRVLAAIGADVEPLFCEIDGTFPNHHPDPGEPHNLEDLKQMVARMDADIGLAFDGDGDRLGVVTRNGNIIFPDRLLMLFATDVLERNPGAVIVYDVKSTGRLPGHILRHGGSPLMWKTGHSLIKAKMRETDAELAGEMSGHFFFKERWYGFDDGIYAAARLLEILALRSETADEVFEDTAGGVSTPELKVPLTDIDPHAVVARFVSDAVFEGARLSTIDGLRADWNDGWGLLRASNTTPVLVLRFEADTPEALARIQQAFRAQLLAQRPELALPF